MTIKISKEISLPLDAVTETFAVLAKRGVGKTYTASVMAEEMLKARQQIVAIDPTGAWWGLQSSADGKSAGYRVVIFGGDHANIPLEETAGEVIATSIIEHGFSAIIDLSLFRKGQANRFMGAFLETLYRLNRNPLHLFVDEADTFAPQKPFGDEARTLGAMEDVVKKGRKKGIGCTLITQRPAVINKNVLTQCEILISLRLVHPRDINTVMEWVNVHADRELAKQMIESLPSLPVGTAWIWSPGWGDIFKRIPIRQRETFDSGATPKAGQTIKNPKKMAEIDIKQLGAAIQETVERKKADDPKVLKKQIADLQQQLKNVKPEKEAVIQVKTKEVPVLKDGQLVKLEKTFGAFQLLSADVIKSLQEIHSFNLDQVKGSILKLKMPAVKLMTESPPVQNFSRPKQNDVVADGSIGKCERALLIVLAERNNKGTNKNQLAILSGYSPSSGGFKNSISKLRQNNFMQGGGDSMHITVEGLDAVGKYTPLPSGVELHRYWLSKLPKCESQVLAYLISCRGEHKTKEDIAMHAGYSVTSGGFKNSLSKLRTLELVEGKGELKASDSLFE